MTTIMLLTSVDLCPAGDGPGRSGFAFSAFVALLVCLVCPLPALSGGHVFFDIGAGYKTGDFGTSIRTDLVHLTPVLGYATPAYQCRVLVPLLVMVYTNDSARQVRNGLGDIILQCGGTILPERLWGLSVDGSLALKIPTADKSDGFGTGKLDVGGFLGLQQRIRMFKVRASGGYIKIGSPPEVHYNDIYLYSVGLTWTVLATDLAAGVQGRRSTVTGFPNPQEITAGVLRALTESLAIRGSGFFGLNKGGPAFGLDVGITKWF